MGHGSEIVAKQGEQQGNAGVRGRHLFFTDSYVNSFTGTKLSLWVERFTFGFLGHILLTLNKIM